jgi:hypothetical protein
MESQSEMIMMVRPPQATHMCQKVQSFKRKEYLPSLNQFTTKKEPVNKAEIIYF